MYWSGSNIWNYATRNSNYNEMDVGFIATRVVKYIKNNFENNFLLTCNDWYNLEDSYSNVH